MVKTRRRPTGRLVLLGLSLGLFLGLSACDEEAPSGTGQDQISDNNSNNNQTGNNTTGTCGDGLCGVDETAESCPADCDQNLNNSNNSNNAGTCGDGTCDTAGGETESNCAQDCLGFGECNCAADETCVSNGEVQQECFPQDCDGQACEDDEVCFQGDCVSSSCAGLDCGDYPNICRGGECVVGSCSDPDVRCPDGQECIDDECRASCTTQEECGALACIGGYCVTCNTDVDCGDTLICIADRCVEPCTLDPDLCTGEQVCDADTGQCTAPCTETGCGQFEVCDELSGQCVDGECNDTSECPEGNLCEDNTCRPVGPAFWGGLASGALGLMDSPSYRAMGVVSPVEQVGPRAESTNYILETGTLSITLGQ